MINNSFLKDNKVKWVKNLKDYDFRFILCQRNIWMLCYNMPRNSKNSIVLSPVRLGSSTRPWWSTTPTRSESRRRNRRDSRRSVWGDSWQVYLMRIHTVYIVRRLMARIFNEDPHCLHWGYEFEGNVHYFLEYPKYTQQRDILSQQFCDIGVPFQINFILNGSSEYSHNLNCKIISYVHNYINSSSHFWHFCNIFFPLPTGWIDWSILDACMYVCECRWRVLQKCVYVYNQLIYKNHFIA